MPPGSIDRDPDRVRGRVGGRAVSPPVTVAEMKGHTVLVATGWYTIGIAWWIGDRCDHPARDFYLGPNWSGGGRVGNMWWEVRRMRRSAGADPHGSGTADARTEGDADGSLALRKAAVASLSSLSSALSSR